MSGERRTELQHFALRLRALKDGGLKFDLDDVLDAIDKSHGRITGINTVVTPGWSSVLETLQVIVNRRARKAA